MHPKFLLSPPPGRFCNHLAKWQNFAEQNSFREISPNKILFAKFGHFAISMNPCPLVARLHVAWISLGKSQKSSFFSPQFTPSPPLSELWTKKSSFFSPQFTKRGRGSEWLSKKVFFFFSCSRSFGH